MCTHTHTHSHTHTPHTHTHTNKHTHTHTHTHTHAHTHHTHHTHTHILTPVHPMYTYTKRHVKHKLPPGAGVAGSHFNLSPKHLPFATCPCWATRAREGGPQLVTASGWGLPYSGRWCKWGFQVGKEMRGKGLGHHLSLGTA